MSDPIATAYAAYQARTTPESARVVLAAVNDREYADLVTAESIRIGALSELRDMIDAEINRLDAELNLLCTATDAQRFIAHETAP